MNKIGFIQAIEPFLATQQLKDKGSFRVSFINFAAREINCKIVYYGAGLGGKTTNLQWIFDQTLGKKGGKTQKKG